MNKFNKFMVMGALALGVAVPALAQQSSNVDNTQTVKNKVEHVINQSIKMQFDKGFLTEKVKMNLSLLDKDDIKKIEEKEDVADNLALRMSGAENQAGRLSDSCTVNIVFDKSGHMDALFAKMPLQNEKQNEIAQKFVALHEHFHCEFSKIDEPVIAFGKSADFQKSINYLLKEQTSIPGLGKIAYIDILNENYGDVGAAMALLKEYGTNDKDVQYVIKSVLETRTQGYAQQALDSHYSQVSLKNLLSEENLKKLENVDGSEFHKMALSIANIGTQDVVANHEKIASSFTSLDHTLLSVRSSALKTIFLNTFTPEELKSEQIIVSPVAQNVSRGMSYDFAQTSLEGIDVKKVADNIRQLLKDSTLKQSLGVSGQQLLIAQVSEQAIKFDLGSAQLKQNLQPVLDCMKEFTDTFPKNNTELANVDKNDIKSKIQSIRKTALAQSSTNSLKIDK